MICYNLSNEDKCLKMNLINKCRSIVLLVPLRSRTSFELEFECHCTLRSKIGCILEMDTADFATGYIPLDTADFATNCFLRHQCIRQSDFATSCIQILELELKTRPRTEQFRIDIL